MLQFRDTSDDKVICKPIEWCRFEMPGINHFFGLLFDDFGRVPYELVKNNKK